MHVERVYTCTTVMSISYGRSVLSHSFFFFFFQAEDGIRDLTVTGVQTCALPILSGLAAVIVTFKHAVRECRNAELAGKSQKIGTNDPSVTSRIYADAGIHVVADPSASLVMYQVNAERHGLPELALITKRDLRRSRHLAIGNIELNRIGVPRERPGRKHLIEQRAIDRRTIDDHRI